MSNFEPAVILAFGITWFFILLLGLTIADLRGDIKKLEERKDERK